MAVCLMMVVCIAWQKEGERGGGVLIVHLVVCYLGRYLPEVCCRVLIGSCARGEREVDVVGGTMENRLVSGGREGSVVEGGR